MGSFPRVVMTHVAGALLALLLVAGHVVYAQSSSCGDGTVDSGEQCDPPGSSCTGAFVGTCEADCTCPAAAVPHVFCYDFKSPPSFSRPGLDLVDRFGTTTADVTKAETLCAPANKNGGDPTAPSDPRHLAGYKLDGPRAGIQNLKVVNEFGTIRLDAVKPARLLVPTAKSLTGPPSPLTAPLDHFQCYKAKVSHGTARFTKIPGVTVQTQFETTTLELVKPWRLCTPVDKGGETPGAEGHPTHFVCYKAKPADKFPRTPVFLDNQFGAQTYEVSKRRELCVPSTVEQPGACCGLDVCGEFTASECTAEGGAFLGGGTACESEEILQVDTTASEALVLPLAIPTCPAGALKNIEARRTFCCVLGFGSPFNDTNFSGQVDTNVALPGGVVAGEVIISTFAGLSCTGSLARPGVGIQSFACGVGPCPPLPITVNYEIMSQDGTSVCADTKVYN